MLNETFSVIFKHLELEKGFLSNKEHLETTIRGQHTVLHNTLYRAEEAVAVASLLYLVLFCLSIFFHLLSM